MPQKNTYTLSEAAAYLGIKDFRMRHILTENLVEAKKVKVKRGKGFYERWQVTRAELDKYAANRGLRKDGKKAYIFRASPEQVAALEVFIAENKMEIEIEPRYKPKS